MRELECVQCGEKYFTEAPNSKYCSLECREAARRTKRLEWENRNAGYNRDYARRFRRKTEKNHAF